MQYFTLLLLLLNIVFTGCSDLSKNKASSISDEKIVFLYEKIAYERENFPLLKEYVNYKYLLHFFDGSKEVLSTNVTWKSSDTNVATIDVNGTARFLKVGETIITATTTVDDRHLSTQTLLNIVDNAVQSIEISPNTKKTVAIGNSRSYIALTTINNFDFPIPVTKVSQWTSSDPTSVSLSLKGSLMVAETTASSTLGDVTLSVLFRSETDSVVLEVQKAKLESIKVTSDLNNSVSVNQSIVFSAKGHYSDGTNKDISNVTWESSDTSILNFKTVPKGKADALSVGDVNVTAKETLSLLPVKDTVLVKVVP